MTPTETEKIRVIVCGAAGRMGREVVRAILETNDLEMAAAIDRHQLGRDAGELAGATPCGVRIGSDLREALTRTELHVLVDFTVPGSVIENVQTCMAYGVSPVIGTTGLTPENLEVFDLEAKKAGLGVFVAPNFAIGAVLMIQFAAQAARYMPDVEILELHHEKKLDSPSGTALLTAQRIAQARNEAGTLPLPFPSDLVEKAPGARGGRNEATGNIPIHSVRLPGFVAHQEVIFGGPGQILTLRHDSTERRSFMPGVLLAVRRVRQWKGLVVGLEHLL